MKSGRWFWGIVLILLGSGFLLEQAKIMEFNEILRMYWPSIVILAGVLGLFERKSSKIGELIVIIIGVVLQLNKLGYTEINIFMTIGPIILIIIGINIMFSKGVKTHKGYQFTNEEYQDDNEEYKKNSEKWGRSTSSDDYIDAFVIFSGLDLINHSLNFRGGKVTAIFGGIDIDLRGTKLDNSEVHMELTALFGGIELKVPEGWKVETTGTPIFGGYSNKTRVNSNPDAPIIKMKCYPIFGGIEIK